MSAWNAVPRFQGTTQLAFFWFRLQACFASAKLASLGMYSFVT